MHTPVLLKEVINYLNIKEEGLYIDATIGEGGYTSEILKLGGRVLGIDIDQEQIKKAKVSFWSEAIESNRRCYRSLRSLQHDIKLVHGNFADIEKIAKENGFFPVDGIIFDLGLSMRQLQESGRGLSFKNEKERLDMRLDTGEEKTAADYINALSEQNLYDLFARNSEEINSRAVAHAVVRARQIRKVKTVGDLVQIIDRAVGEKDTRVLRRIFQALRIEVNHEFENLKKGLEGSVKLIKKEGKVLVITFHSLEDRIVKQFVRERSLKFETKKPVTVKGFNRFERSAKLRVITL